MIEQLTHNYLGIAIASMLPLIESQGAVILGVAWGLSPIKVLLLSVAVNFVVVYLVLLGLTFFTDWLRQRSKFFDRFFAWLFKRTYHRHSEKFERWGSFALTIFILFPLPFSGAWTGSLLAYLFGIKLHHAAVLLFVGIFIAATITLAAALGGVALIRL